MPRLRPLGVQYVPLLSWPYSSIQVNPYLSSNVNDHDPEVLVDLTLRRRHKQKCQRYESTLPRYVCNLSSPTHSSTLLAVKFFTLLTAKFFQEIRRELEFRSFIWKDRVLWWIFASDWELYDDRK